jgi:hypothetical protein
LTDLHRGGIFGEAFSYQLSAASRKSKRIARPPPKPEKNWVARRAPWQAIENRAFQVTGNKVKDLNRLKIRDSSLGSE